MKGRVELRVFLCDVVEVPSVAKIIYAIDSSYIVAVFGSLFYMFHVVKSNVRSHVIDSDLRCIQCTLRQCAVNLIVLKEPVYNTLIVNVPFNLTSKSLRGLLQTATFLI
uniref:Uncharacterized protein n=1 Tax=Rhizophagus irregularis (strain DAOM 181602 / DAOM 197198 / MUCL 43194) TaxID=747089 RepID=U9TZJ6_RHIID